MLRITITALGTLVFASAANAADCRLAGTWMHENGDVMVLGAIADPSRGGSFQFQTGTRSPISMRIVGGYRIEGSVFHFRGNDESGRLRDVSMPIVSITSTTLQLLSDNRITGRSVQVWQLRERDASCA